MRITTAQKKFLSQGSDATFRTFVHDFLAFSARLMAVRAGFGDRGFHREYPGLVAQPGAGR